MLCIRTRGILLLSVSYSLSFSPDFFRSNHPDGPDDLQSNESPTSVEQAIRSLSDDVWESLARVVFRCDPEYLDVETILRRIVETNTCSNLDSPVDVWIDRGGGFRVRVFEEQS
ncbi:MAG: hypothetical protein HZA46_02175 [Planctomycetales bacterium]|nr:hypothetical protein [Planctomycetales bacterium]